MTDYKYTVVRVGVHPRDSMDLERLELERVGARHVVVPYTDDPDEVIEAARTADGVIMGLSHRDLALHGVQFHPESIASEHGHRLIQNFLEIARGKPGDKEAA